MKLKYICDKARHLICIPYSIENLHIMAEDLGLKRCWFHKNHYDIPKKRIKEISEKCREVGFYTIKEIINSPAHAEAILSSEARGSAAPKDYFQMTQIEYHGTDINR